jgi:UDP-N-acetylmuramate: L-alanyl-gamma-D-glutamyl-meso-diaminopimelate ligase
MPKIHFIAIGGAAMHHLALALKVKGYQITGSDDEIYEPSKSLLASHGILPDKLGWFPEKITSHLDAVIVGMHAKVDNPELMRAQELGVKIKSYPSFLYEESQHKQRIVIAGSHGKTSITSMILHVLKSLNKKFDYLVGAHIEGFQLMASLSEAPIIIIEGDEYLASPIDRQAKFLLYQPHIALISGIAWDHINVYPSFKSYTDSFDQLIKQLPKAGHLFFDQTDETLSNLVKNCPEDVDVNGYEAHQAEIKNGNTTLLGVDGKRYEIQVFGQHTLKNLNGARLICEEIGISSSDFYASISTFKGAAKRLELVAKSTNSLFYKDFAHAPSKVAATAAALKEQFPERKLVACLELHTFSSLNPAFLPEYQSTLAKADEAIIYLSEHARQIKQMDHMEESLIQNYFKHPSLKVIRDSPKLATEIRSKSWHDANLVMMSSGTFDGLDLKDLATMMGLSTI